MPNVLGTSAYMAPEQAAGLPVSPASDWYSLGSMLYEVLTGHPPFPGRPHQVLGDLLLARSAPAPSELVPDVPDDLNVLCVDLLKGDPGGGPTGRDLLLRPGSRTLLPTSRSLRQPRHQRAPSLVGRARDLESSRPHSRTWTEARPWPPTSMALRVSARPPWSGTSWTSLDRLRPGRCPRGPVLRAGVEALQGARQCRRCS